MFGYDVDYLLAYPTVKYVSIQDARLGLVHYLSMVAILGYVGIFKMWYECAYLKASTVTGTVRFTLQQPTYSCNPADEGCLNKFHSIYETPYCSQSGLPCKRGNKFPCWFLENIGAEKAFHKSMMVTTRQTNLDQRLICNSTVEPTCPHIYETLSSSTHYTLDAEYFTVLVDHSVVASAFNRLISSTQHGGRLFVPNNDKLCKYFEKTATADVHGQEKWYPGYMMSCYIRPNTTSAGLDFFSLNVLMQSAGIDLNAEHYKGRTYRETGAIMILEITVMLTLLLLNKYFEICVAAGALIYPNPKILCVCTSIVRIPTCHLLAPHLIFARPRYQV